MSKTCMVWEVDVIGTYCVSLDIDKTESLSQEEIKPLVCWTRTGLEWIEWTF